MASGELQFAAFLSYSRKDVRLARWLVRSLEQFRLPRQTLEDLKARRAPFFAARPIFRDEHDMPVGGVISDRLSEVLDASAMMIVLCTASSAKSDWVNREIELFASRHPDRRIIPAVAEGEPDSDETYPHALLKLGKPLAADLRNPGDRRQSMIKIAAAMLGLDVDQLVGRVQKHRAEQRRWIAVGGAAAAAVVVGLGVTAGMMANNAKRANTLARDQVELLLTSTRDEVQAAGLLSARSAVIAVAEGYFDGKRPGELTDKDLLLKAKLLMQKGEDADERGEADQALGFRQAAFAATEELLSRDRRDPDRIFEYGQSAFWLGELHLRRGESGEARTYLQAYLTSAKRLLTEQPNYPSAALEVGYATANIGLLAVEQTRDPREAVRLFSEGIQIVEPHATDSEARRNLNLILGYQTQALAQFENASVVLALVEKWDGLINRLDADRSADRSLSLDVARDLTLVGEFESRAGHEKKGKAYLARALAIASEQLKLDPDNRDWLSFASGLELKSSTEFADCSSSVAFDFNRLDDIRRALSCIRKDSYEGDEVCRAFTGWLGVQRPHFQSEHLWAAVLAECSREKAVSADRELKDLLDQLAEKFFFSHETHGFSLWTQIELAGFQSTGRNLTRADALTRDLERRGWNVDRS